MTKERVLQVFPLLLTRVMRMWKMQGKQERQELASQSLPPLIPMTWRGQDKAVCPARAAFCWQRMRTALCPRTCRLPWPPLGLQQRVPPADLRPLRVLHLLPVALLLLPAAALAQGDPAHHLLALHAAPVVDGDQQGDVRQLEEGDLEDESFLVDRVGLAPAEGGLATRHLLTHGVAQAELPIGI